MSNEAPIRTATLKVISDGSVNGSRVIIVDDAGEEHQLNGVMGIKTDMTRQEIPKATIECHCLGAWPGHKAKQRVVNIDWGIREP